MVADNQSPFFFPSDEYHQIAADTWIRQALAAVRPSNTFLVAAIDRLTALITNQDRLSEVIRQKQAELIRMNTNVSAANMQFTSAGRWPTDRLNPLITRNSFPPFGTIASLTKHL